MNGNARRLSARPLSLVSNGTDNTSRDTNENLFNTHLTSGPLSQRIDLSRVRDGMEYFYLTFVWIANAIVFLIASAYVISDMSFLFPILFIIGAYLLFDWVRWKLSYAFIFGNSIQVGPNQHPQIYKVVKQACEYLSIDMPTILIFHGHGLFELLVAKQFSRRGIVLITSNMLDEFAKKPSSREFMMYAGRQLGHIKAGHFKFWFFKDVIGLTALFFHTAWKRRCHFTADRIGLLAAGSLYPAEQALFILTCGGGIAAGTNYDSIVEQKAELFERWWSWINLAFSSYPYMIDRIVRLREFAVSIGLNPEQVQALPIEHTSLRALPILIIHGHDKMALLELKDILHSKFPNVAPRVMLTENVGSLSLPEKFEEVAMDILGAIALVTPDDVGHPNNDESALAARARQNVVIEIGWVWGKLGRERCMLLMRGNIELPSDLSGIDVQMFEKSPRECIPAVHSFVGNLAVGAPFDRWLPVR